MNQTTKTERGKTQIEVTFATRQQLRLLAALTGTGMAEAAADAIGRRLDAAKHPLLSAEEAYDQWIAGKAGPAFAGDTDVRTGFIDGYLLASGAEET